MKKFIYVTLFAVFILLIAVVTWIGPNEENKAFLAVKEYTEAIADDDRDVLKKVMTSEAFSDYVTMRDNLQRADGVLKAFGHQSPNLSEIELISVTCERIEGDTAYMSTETKLGDKSQFERIVLKKEGDQWKVAGKQ